MGSERRQYQRVSFDQSAKLMKDKQTFACQIIDLSIHGVLLRPHGVLRSNLDSIYELEIPLDGSNTCVNMTIKLAHKNPDNLGFVCEKMDLDSISHLRKIIELNSGDPVILERDFATLCEGNP